MKNIVIHMSCILFLLLSINLSHSAMYSCPDGKGNRFYSNTPCTGGQDFIKKNSSSPDQTKENAPEKLFSGGDNLLLEREHLPEDYENIAIGRLKSRLFDPYSLKIVKKSFFCEIDECTFYLDYNAKNRYGGYVGEKTMFFIFKQKILVKTL